MFGLTPFERNELWNPFREFENEFFKGFGSVNGEYIRRERRYGSYCRSFDISGIDENAIDAAYTNGILMLTLPKKEKQQPESKRIEIK